MRTHRAPQRGGDGAHLVGPCGVRPAIPGHLGEHRLDHQQIDRLALRNVVVERHRARAQLGRERAHGEAGEALPVEQAQGGRLQLRMRESGGSAHRVLH